VDPHQLVGGVPAARGVRAAEGGPRRGLQRGVRHPAEGVLFDHDEPGLPDRRGLSRGGDLQDDRLSSTPAAAGEVAAAKAAAKEGASGRGHSRSRKRDAGTATMPWPRIPRRRLGDGASGCSPASRPPARRRRACIATPHTGLADPAPARRVGAEADDASAGAFRSAARAAHVGPPRQNPGAHDPQCSRDVAGCHSKVLPGRADQPRPCECPLQSRTCARKSGIEEAQYAEALRIQPESADVHYQPGRTVILEGKARRGEDTSRLP